MCCMLTNWAVNPHLYYDHEVPIGLSFLSEIMDFAILIIADYKNCKGALLPRSIVLGPYYGKDF